MRSFIFSGHAVNEFFVYFVADDVYVFVFKHSRQRPYLRLGIYRAVGVGRVVEHERLGLGRYGLFQLLRRHFEIRSLIRIYVYDGAARHFNELGIGQPVRRGQYDLVAGIDYRVESVAQRLLAAVGNDYLFGRVIQPVVALEFVADGLSQFHRARNGRILRHTLVERDLRRLDDVPGGVEIGLARTEGHDVQALRLHCFCLRRDSQRQQRRDVFGSVRYLHIRFLSPCL